MDIRRPPLTWEAVNLIGKAKRSGQSDISCPVAHKAAEALSVEGRVQPHRRRNCTTLMAEGCQIEFRLLLSM